MDNTLPTCMQALMLCRHLPKCTVSSTKARVEFESMIEEDEIYQRDVLFHDKHFPLATALE